MQLRLFALVSLAACGGSPSTDPAPATPVASIIAPRASEGDVVVAQVNGRPVWGSCVTEQTSRGAPDRTVALDQCISFELLAQAAETRGLGADATVIETLRTTMVSELVAADFEARYQKPQDLGPAMDAVLAKNAWRMHRPELRASGYVRAMVPPNAGPEVEARAKQLAEAIAAELANETGLFRSHVLDVATRLAKDSGIEIESEDVPLATRKGDYEPPYLEALFSIAEAHRISKPARTTRGWDVVLWSGGLAAKETSREALAWDVFPELRRAQFTTWVNGLVKAGGFAIEIDQASVAQLDKVAP